ncbi:MAG: biotin/lipoyl-binding protein [Armatimonadetes bacterium]|nr:biotin/lipoyl-binding protein [Armatimonadota bacterium]
MTDLNARIDELADLMDEYQLERGKLTGEGWSVAFARTVSLPPSSETPERAPATTSKAPKPRKPDGPSGHPVNSPTTGIFYASPNPGAPAFVKVGDSVEAGQVIGLIEAMKVFNEITVNVSGVVRQILVQNGQLVQPGDTILTVG